MKIQVVNIIRYIIICVLSLFIAASCSGNMRDIPEEDQEENMEPEYDKPEPSAGAPVDGVRLAWDYSSYTTIADEGGCYARVIRLESGGLMSACETAGTVAIRKCFDGGTTWGGKRVVINSYVQNGVKVNAANAEICQLADGTLLCAANYRPSAEGVAPWSIAVSISEDGGNVWSDRKIVYKADKYSANGCWEPYFLELPDGTVHLYFANEAPYTNSSEQEISVISSSDKGRNWSSKAKTVSFRKGYRDGMPVARIFNDQIVVAIEDNVYGNFVPFTVRCPLSDSWSSPITALSKGRSQALLEDLQDNNIYAGAPYLLKLPSGEAVMSYQRAYTDNWELSLMEVVVGDEEARNFTRPSRPFQVPYGSSCLWNSLALIDDSTIAAVGSLNSDKVTKPVMKKAVVMTDMCVQPGSVSHLPVFIGSRGLSNMRAGIAHTESDFLFRFQVSDNTPFSSKDKSDGIYVYIDVLDKLWTDLYDGLYRIWVPSTGQAVISRYYKGAWRKIESVSAVNEDMAGGYKINLTLPKSLLGEINQSQIRVGMTLCDYSSTDTGYEESLADMNRNAPCTWMPFNIREL